MAVLAESPRVRKIITVAAVGLLAAGCNNSRSREYSSAKRLASPSASTSIEPSAPTGLPSKTPTRGSSPEATTIPSSVPTRRAETPSPSAQPNPCDTASHPEQVTVEPNNGIVTVFATPEHPSIVVKSATTYGENKNLTINWPGQGPQVLGASDAGTVLLTTTNVPVDTSKDSGFWAFECLPTAQDGKTEQQSRVADVLNGEGSVLVYHVKTNGKKEAVLDSVATK